MIPQDLRPLEVVRESQHGGFSGIELGGQQRVARSRQWDNLEPRWMEEFPRGGKPPRTRELLVYHGGDADLLEQAREQGKLPDAGERNR